eukprot:1018519-Rhodomonas_salina.1
MARLRAYGDTHMPVRAYAIKLRLFTRCLRPPSAPRVAVRLKSGSRVEGRRVEARVGGRVSEGERRERGNEGAQERGKDQHLGLPARAREGAVVRVVRADEVQLERV